MGQIFTKNFIYTNIIYMFDVLTENHLYRFPSSETIIKMKKPILFIIFCISGLLINAQVVLVGTTNADSSQSPDKGVIFSFDPVTFHYDILHTFTGGNGDGKNPVGSLVKYTDGKYYGMTNLGGASDKGTIYSYDPTITTGNPFKVEISFTGDDAAQHNNFPGANPAASLVLGPGNYLYGTTLYGGKGSFLWPECQAPNDTVVIQLNGGTLFRFKPGVPGSYRVRSRSF